MKFTSIDWADSDLERINIEYDLAVLVIWNNVLQTRFFVSCSGLAGITNLCIWDDTIIMNASVRPVSNRENEFLTNLYAAYDDKFDYGGRSLNTGLLELKIELSNYISFSVYCQKITIQTETNTKTENCCND